VSYGPALNAAAVLLACYGNVPPERAAQVMGMLFGVPVSAGWAEKAAARVSAQLVRAGFDEAMIAALTAEDVLAADETPVNVLDRTAPAPEEGKEDSDPDEKEGKAAAGGPHVLITRTPDRRLTFLQAIASRRKAAIAAGPSHGITWRQPPAARARSWSSPAGGRPGEQHPRGGGRKRGGAAQAELLVQHLRSGLQPVMVWFWQLR